ncbi:substrate-binding periplasmic protein [Paraburkholderia tropica]|uniref:Amino acid ABC transporter substrate-binding protein, PAAT family n=2 Tax=Burkholderiaceae TaxID=119060 RepID=A0AAQ1GKQ8_9BURK|nr:ABC transporter substrate-binding protein [Paraburkholderia tropica]RQN38191.1 amino acid ABC transporter substrate-binding protein [Paraburkholderia tropica]SEK07801.1 amino acid ABC transporter substrate-binding protein, PAAT family [Paraburkholderia tropica]
MSDLKKPVKGRRSLLLAGGAAIAGAPLVLAGKARAATPDFAPGYEGFSMSKYDGDDSLLRIQKKGELVIGTSNDWPYSYLDAKTGAFSGIDADIIHVLAKMLKIPKVTVATASFDGLVPGVLSGRFDMVGDSIHFTPDRAKVVDFSFPTYFYAETMVVKKGSGISARDISELKGKSAGSILGTNYSDWIQKTPGVEYRGYKDAQSVVQDVASGRLDVGIYDLPVMAAIIKQYPQWPVEIVKAYVPRTTKVPANFSRYIFRQQDQQLNIAISRALESMQYTGQMQAIIARHGIGEG